MSFILRIHCLLLVNSLSNDVSGGIVIVIVVAVREMTYDYYDQSFTIGIKLTWSPSCLLLGFLRGYFRSLDRLISCNLVIAPLSFDFMSSLLSSLCQTPEP